MLMMALTSPFPSSSSSFVSIMKLNMKLLLGSISPIDENLQVAVQGDSKLITGEVNGKFAPKAIALMPYESVA